MSLNDNIHIITIELVHYYDMACTDLEQGFPLVLVEEKFKELRSLSK